MPPQKVFRELQDLPLDFMREVNFGQLHSIYNHALLAHSLIAAYFEWASPFTSTQGQLFLAGR
jgi:hypothetical protein